jgi:hypothetical protein
MPGRPAHGSNTQMRFTRPLRCLSRPLFGTALAVLAAAGSAQVMQAPGTMPDGRKVSVPGGNAPATVPGSIPSNPLQQHPAVHTGATTAAPAPGAPGAAPFVTPRPGSDLPSQPQVAPSLLDKPAQPATVKLSAGSLSVAANNSSLTDILHSLSTASGMTIDGLGKDQRVFGIYGPGSPREILSQLLDGAGYNFLMVGQTDAGVPREIVLTARTNAPISPPSASSRTDEDEEPPPPPTEDTPTIPAAPPPSDQPQRPRTPQQMLQDLQQRNQQQQQPQQQTPQ